MATTKTGTMPGNTCACNQKRLATLKALAAIAGHRLEQVQSGFVVSRWTHSRHCDDLDQVETLLTRMGATHG